MNHFYKLALNMVSISIGLSFNLTAAAPGLPWTKVAGVYGGAVQCVTEDSYGTLYAGSAGNGILLSSDGGLTWTQTPGLKNIDAMRGLSAIVVDSSRYIYAATESGVYRSVDRGLTFTLLNQGAAPLSSVHALIQRSNGDLLAGSQAGLSILPKGSLVWRAASKIPSTYPFVFAMTMNSAQTELFVATYNSGSVFETTDWGVTWKKSSAIPGYVSGNSVTALDTDSTGHLYAGLGINQLSNITGGVSVSPDNGLTWSTLRVTGRGISALASYGSKVFAGTVTMGGGGAVYQSSDYGQTFSRVTSGIGTSTGPINDISSNGRGLFVSTTGLYTSVDSGVSWAPVSHLQVDRTVQSVLTTANGDIYVSAQNEGVSRSKDHGLTWTVINAGLDGNLSIGKLALNSLGEVIGYPSRTWGHSVRLPGNGNTWVQSDLYTTFLGLGLNQQNNLVAVASTGNGVDTYISTDGGTHFTYLSHVVRGWGTSGAAAAGRIYAGTEAADGFMSSDNGQTWTDLGPTPNNVGFGFSPNGTPFFINADAHVMQYMGGTAWAISDTGVTYGFTASTFFTDASGHFFMNGNNGQVWLSTDEGNHWSAFQTGLPVVKERSRGLGMDSLGYLYMGYDNDLGLYRTSTVVGIP